MAVPINIPKLGMTMDDAKLLEWCVGEGEPINKGEVVLIVETEKVANEIEATASGFLFTLASAGESFDVGQTVGWIAETQEELVTLQKEHPRIDSPDTAEAPVAANVPDGENESPLETRRIVSSPAARRIAKELAINLADVKGTGPGGRVIKDDILNFHEAGAKIAITPLANKMARQTKLDISTIAGSGTKGKITKSDIEKALETPAPATQGHIQEKTVIPYSGMRRNIGLSMKNSLLNTAQLQIFSEVDVTETVRFRNLVREEFRRDESVKVSYTDILILVVSRALKQFPLMNTTLIGEEIHIHETVNVGIAVAIKEGLIVPVLKDADRKGLLEIAKESRVLAQKAREGALSTTDVADGTFTLSNVSMFPVDGVTPILRPPETGILGAGRVIEKPAVYDGEIAVRSMMTLSLTFDHQVVDGAPACAFLAAVARQLQHPVLMAL